MLRNLGFLTLTLLLAGCIAQADIQADYMSQESDCRGEAQRSGEFGDKQDAANAAYRIGSAFSSCMNKAGWKVSVPKPPAPPAGSTAATTNAPLQATTPPVSVAAPANAAKPQSAVTSGRVPPASPILGPGVQPSPAPASVAPIDTPRAAAPAPSYSSPSSAPSVPSVPSSGYSTYQPARPDGVAEPNYGSGAGRNF